MYKPFYDRIDAAGFQQFMNETCGLRISSDGANNFLLGLGDQPAFTRSAGALVTVNTTRMRWNVTQFLTYLATNPNAEDRALREASYYPAYLKLRAFYLAVCARMPASSFQEAVLDIQTDLAGTVIPAVVVSSYLQCLFLESQGVTIRRLSDVKSPSLSLSFRCSPGADQTGVVSISDAVFPGASNISAACNITGANGRPLTWVSRKADIIEGQDYNMTCRPNATNYNNGRSTAVSIAFSNADWDAFSPYALTSYYSFLFHGFPLPPSPPSPPQPPPSIQPPPPAPPATCEDSLKRASCSNLHTLDAVAPDLIDLLSASADMGNTVNDQGDQIVKLLELVVELQKKLTNINETVMGLSASGQSDVSRKLTAVESRLSAVEASVGIIDEQLAGQEATMDKLDVLAANVTSLSLRQKTTDTVVDSKLTRIENNIVLLANASASASKATSSAVGDMKWSALTADHAGWLLCNGRSVTSARFKKLFDVIGTAFGGFNATFTLPDARGRVVAGIVTDRAMGVSMGSETYRLKEDEMPAHAHGGFTDDGGNHQHYLQSSNPLLQYDAGGSSMCWASGSCFGTYYWGNTGENSYYTSTTGDHYHSLETFLKGGDSPHTNMQPTLFAGNLFIYSGDA